MWQNWQRLTSCAVLAMALATLGALGDSCPADEVITPFGSAAPTARSAAERGYQFLTTKPYLPPDFTQDVFDELWRTWEEPLRSQAAQATPEERRKMAFSRYGLTTSPVPVAGLGASLEKSATPQQYIVDDAGNWTMTCLACHQGKVAGRVIPGAPNSLFALQTLTEEVRETKIRLKQKLTRMDIGSLFMPLGTSNGTTNAVMFGVALMATRDPDLNVLPPATPPKMTHHDHDAPAWWLFHRKQMLYSDAFVPKSHRSLMQFMLVKTNGPEKFRQWESDFRDIYAWLDSLRAPAYPFEIDRPLAAQGEQVFQKHCAECHGTYGKDSQYPGRVVPIDQVGTDRLRLDSLATEYRSAYGNSWFAAQDSRPTELNPGGYAAPPLDGVWASAPYFHNGSVPTLWHVLHPGRRPSVWQRSEDGYDRQRVGLEVTEFEILPSTVTTAKARRTFFDTRVFGKSAAGHLFPNDLDEAEKRAVLEYLKTL